MDFYVWIKYKTQLPLCFGEHNLCGWRQAAVFVMKCNILNITGQFYITKPIIYVARARGPLVACARCSVVDELAFPRSV